MTQFLLLAGLLFSTFSALGQSKVPLTFSIIKTGEASTIEANVFSGGSFFEKVKLNHSAILIQHGQDIVMLDTGLGTNIDEQFKDDMPTWAKIFFSYEKLVPVTGQLPEALKNQIQKIYLTHVHWDHASGISDFNGPCVAIPDEEAIELKDIMRTTTFPSQFPEKIKWCNFSLTETPYRGFSRSFDVFGDQSMVIVHLPGHSHGSVGVFLNTSSQSFFFVGDATWSLKGLKLRKGKSFGASTLVDRDKTKTQETVDILAKFAEENPKVKIIPAHDAYVQDELGYFPKWID